MELNEQLQQYFDDTIWLGKVEIIPMTVEIQNKLAEDYSLSFLAEKESKKGIALEKVDDGVYELAVDKGRFSLVLELVTFLRAAGAEKQTYLLHTTEELQRRVSIMANQIDGTLELRQAEMVPTFKERPNLILKV